MAKITGGLMSMKASGQIGKALVFASWKGVDYARVHVTPKNPQTVAQVAQRDLFVFMHEIYKASPQEFRNPWELLATGKPFTAWNAVMTKNIPLIKGGTDLSAFVFEEGAGGGPQPASVTVTPGTAQVSVTIGLPTIPVGWTTVGGVLLNVHSVTPSGDIAPPIQAAVVTTGPFTHVFTGLTTGQKYLGGGYFHYLDASGNDVFSQSVQSQVTAS